MLLGCNPTKCFLAAESDPSRVVNPFRRFPGGQAWDLPRGRSKSRVMGDIDKSLVDPMSDFFSKYMFFGMQGHDELQHQLAHLGWQDLFSGKHVSKNSKTGI